MYPRVLGGNLGVTEYLAFDVDTDLSTLAGGFTNSTDITGY